MVCPENIGRTIDEIEVLLRLHRGWLAGEGAAVSQDMRLCAVVTKLTHSRDNNLMSVA
jgi:hypothetical protein